MLNAHADSVGDVPAFSIHAPNGQNSILIGSLHIPHEKLRQPAGSILDGASYFVVEHTTTAVAARPPEFAPGVLQKFLDGKKVRAKWAEFLTVAQVEVLRKNYACASSIPMSADAFEFLLMVKSPKLISELAYAPCSLPGLRSRDDILQRYAGEYAVPTVTLETEAEIELRRASIPDQIFEHSLQIAFAENAAKRLSMVVDAMNAGDFLTVATITNSTFENKFYSDLYNRIMLKERNHAWMPGLCQYLDNGRAVVLVGASHLAGADGLIALLARAGYIVTPINLPSDRSL